MNATTMYTFAGVLLAVTAQDVWGQAGHRMGGVPEMPAQMLQAGEDDEHHMRYHGGQDEPVQDFSFGRRLPSYDVDVQRFIALELRDGAWRFPQPIKVKSGDIVRFELRNTGRAEHEFRIGDPRTAAREDRKSNALIDLTLTRPPLRYEINVKAACD